MGMTKLLEGKNAVIYGACGPIGTAVVRTFAREGATVHLVGRTRGRLVGEVAVLDERHVDAHAAVDAGLTSAFPTARAGARHGAGVDPEQILAGVAQMTMLKRAPELDQIAETAAFPASDRAGAITSGIVNATCAVVAG
jgi:NAD(P)-dependent dehydrogenase (short-subunit alcohol dehydrogenase family)